MNPKRKFLSKWWIHPATAFVLFAAAACNSKPSLKRTQEKSAEQNSSSRAQNFTNPDIDLNCVMDHIQNPTEAFHYSYKKDGPNFVDNEADITPQTIDGSFKNNSISSPVHGVRSDKDSWQTAWSGLMGIAGMSSTVALVNHSSAMVREGSEKMNGYDAIRYSIDTARASGAESTLYQSTLGPGGFEKGTAWVTSQGCPVKFSLDSEMHLHDGSVDKIHYEVEMIKK
ncbi:MAG TPA: hypothetical protein VNH65_06240 [Candidatus Acidoferrum sp.]|nr:hypothetical protein [Candidatus Acidoferrum sp.]